MVKKLLYHEFHPHPYICSLDHSYMHMNDLVSTDAHLMLNISDVSNKFIGRF